MRVSFPKRSAAVVRRRRMWGKKKFLGKYSKGLGSMDKVYAFKRLGQDIQLVKAPSSANLNVYQNGAQTTTGMFSTGIPSADTFATGDGRVGYYQIPARMLFRLSDVEQVSDLTSLFDDYKISGVKVKIHWHNNNSLAQPGWGERPSVLYAVDDDDAALPSTESVLRQKNNVKQFTFGGNKPLTLYIKPRASTALYSAGSSTAYTGYGPASRGQWIDCASSSVEHYGLKMWFRNINFGDGTENQAPPCHFRVETTFYLKYKGVQ